MAEQPQTAQLLIAWGAGETSARDALIARIYPELQAIAAARLRSDRASSLSTGDLINDAVIRIIAAERLTINDRAHLLALASHVMRNILIDHARSKQAGKRDHQKVELRTEVDGGRRIDLLLLDSALVRLKALDGELAKLVEMRYFGGMTVSDVAEATGWSEMTVKRRWQVARAWLTDALDDRVGNA